MGNQLQRNAQVDNETVTPAIVELTQAEIQIIKSTWQIPSTNAFDSAEHIFYTFLERFPENQQKFSAFRDKPLAELKGTATFRAHASKIFNTFSSIVDALDKDVELKGIKRIIAEVGKSHIKRKISKKSCNDLRSVVVDVLSDVCKLDDEGKVAWSKLLDVFFHVLFECLDGRSDKFF